MADGPPEWVWTRGFKCFQRGVADHLEDEEEEQGGNKSICLKGPSRLKTPHQFNKCQRALLSIRYHKSGFSACLKRWPSKCEKGGLTCLDWTKSAFHAYTGNGDKACTETLVLLEVSGTTTAKSSRSKSRTNSGKHGTRQEQSPFLKNWVSKGRHAVIGLCAFTGWTGGCPRVCRIYNPLLDAVINRQRLMFKVCRWESPTVSLCRRERVGSRVDYPYRDNPTGSHTHTHAQFTDWSFMLQHRSAPNRGGNCVQIRDSGFLRSHQLQCSFLLMFMCN